MQIVDDRRIRADRLAYLGTGWLGNRLLRFRKIVGARRGERRLKSTFHTRSWILEGVWDELLEQILDVFNIVHVSLMILIDDDRVDVPESFWLLIFLKGPRDQCHLYISSATTSSWKTPVLNNYSHPYDWLLKRFDERSSLMHSGESAVFTHCCTAETNHTDDRQGRRIMLEILGVCCRFETAFPDSDLGELRDGVWPLLDPTADTNHVTYQ